MRVILSIYSVMFYFHVGEKKTNEKVDTTRAVEAGESTMNSCYCNILYTVISVVHVHVVRSH